MGKCYCHLPCGIGGELGDSGSPGPMSSSLDMDPIPEVVDDPDDPEPDVVEPVVDPADVVEAELVMITAPEEVLGRLFVSGFDDNDSGSPESIPDSFSFSRFLILSSLISFSRPGPADADRFRYSVVGFIFTGFSGLGFRKV